MNLSLMMVIGYKNGETIKPLCIILPQMNGFIKYFDNNKKACHFWLIMMM